MAETPEKNQHPHTAMDIPYAGFEKQLFALTIDVLLLFIISVLLNGRFLFLISMIYFVICWTFGGRTIGNFVMGIRVLYHDGRQAGIPTALIRYFGYLISFMPLGLGFLWIIWDAKKQGWHDKLAKTIVIRTR